MKKVIVMTFAPITPTRCARLFLAVALCVFLSPAVLASDPDDDWGLPAKPVGNGQTTGSDIGDSSDADSKAVMAAQPLGFIGELVHADLLPGEVGSLELGVDGGAPVAPTSAEQASEADVVSADLFRELRVRNQAQSLLVQGSMRVTPQAGTTAALRAPQFAAYQVALLTLDDGQASSLDELVNSSFAGHLEQAVSLGSGFETLDLIKLRKLVAAHSEALAGKAVSVLVVSVDTDGEVHISAARIQVSDLSLDVVAR